MGIISDGTLRKVEEKEKAKDEQRTIKQLSPPSDSFTRNYGVIFFTKRTVADSSRDTAFGTVARLRDGQPKNCCSIPARGNGFFSARWCWDWLWNPPGLPPICTGRIFAYVKRLGDEFDLSHPSSAEAMNEQSYTSTPPRAVMFCTTTTLLQFIYFPLLYCTLLLFVAVWSRRKHSRCRAAFRIDLFVSRIALQPMNTNTWILIYKI